MSKFAVIETGGKQYKVSEGDVISIEKINPPVGEEFKEGTKITFDKVLLTDNGKDTKVGTPYLEGVRVDGTLEEAGRGKKIHIIRFKSKSNYSKKTGHRQPYFKVKINSIK